MMMMLSDNDDGHDVMEFVIASSTHKTNTFELVLVLVAWTNLKKTDKLLQLYQENVFQFIKLDKDQAKDKFHTQVSAQKEKDQKNRML